MLFMECNAQNQLYVEQCDYSYYIWNTLIIFCKILQGVHFFQNQFIIKGYVYDFFFKDYKGYLLRMSITDHRLSKASKVLNKSENLVSTRLSIHNLKNNSSR